MSLYPSVSHPNRLLLRGDEAVALAARDAGVREIELL